MKAARLTPAIRNPWEICNKGVSKRMTVTKTDFIQLYRERHGCSKRAADDAVNSVLDLITECLGGGDTVFFYGFGCFDRVERKTRKFKDPYGKPCEVSTHWVPRFYPGNSLKRAVKKWEDNRNRGLA